MDSIMDIIQNQVIQAGIKWILGLLSPVGAFVKAIMAIIDVVKFFVRRRADRGIDQCFYGKCFRYCSRQGRDRSLTPS